MIEDNELIRIATETTNPRDLSPSMDAGGVASALVTEKGTVFTGVCINTACSMGFCAEHNAIGTMLTAGESKIATIVAVDDEGRILPPCGRCREFIYQTDPYNSNTRVLLPGGRVKSIAELLPDHWREDKTARELAEKQQGSA